jgi:hypothetical protein
MNRYSRRLTPFMFKLIWFTVFAVCIGGMGVAIAILAEALHPIVEGVVDRFDFMIGYEQ